jgi:hypothetical protein
MPNPRMTTSDVAWSVLFMAIFMPLMIGSVIALFTLGGPALASPSSLVLKLFGMVAVMVTILLVGLLSLWLFGLLTRRFLSTTSYERWHRQVESGSERVLPLLTTFSRFTLRMVKPKQADDAL